MYPDSFIEKMSQDGVLVGYAGAFHFPDQTYRNHTGVGEIEIEGQTFFGVGELGRIGSVKNVADANPSTVDVGLVGLPSDIFQSVLHGNIRGSSVELFKVIFAPTGQVLAAANILVGQVTDYTWSFDETGEISITVADEFTLYERPLQKFYTHSDWLSEHDGDNYWQYVSQMSDKQIHWGAEQDGTKFTAS